MKNNSENPAIGNRVYTNKVRLRGLRVILKTHILHHSFTGSQALPGNRYLEALPRLVTGEIEAEPLDLRYQAEPGNE